MGEDLFYNRYQSITGSISFSTGRIDATHIPTYDSTITFEASNNNYALDDNLFNNVPLSPNHLTAKFNLVYHLGLDDAQKMVAVIESMTGQASLLFEYNTGVFRPQYGYCSSYNITHLNPRHYQISLEMDVLDVAVMMQWSGGGYMSGGWSPWVTSQSYQKFDIVYSGVNGNKLNNFYYCTGDHTATSDNSPTGDTSMWTQSFFFEPDQGFASDMRPTVETLEFLNSKKQKVTTKKNISVVPMGYTFSSRSNREAKAILHFLENKGGFRRFRHDPPSLFDAPKVVYCPQWEYQANYIDHNTISLTLIEDPIGVIPTGT